MWGHSESIVRVIELELFVVLFFLIVCIANVSNYSKSADPPRVEASRVVF